MRPESPHQVCPHRVVRIAEESGDLFRAVSLAQGQDIRGRNLAGTCGIDYTSSMTFQLQMTDQWLPSSPLFLRTTPVRSEWS